MTPINQQQLKAKNRLQELRYALAFSDVLRAGTLHSQSSHSASPRAAARIPGRCSSRCKDLFPIPKHQKKGKSDSADMAAQLETSELYPSVKLAG